MEGNRIFIGSVLSVVVSIFGSIWFATQFVAASLEFDPALGAPWFGVGGVGVFKPWMIFLWDYSYGAYAREEFVKGYLIILAGVFVGVLIAVCLSVIRGRKRENSKTHGSSRFATKREIATTGLVCKRGVVLGLDRRGRYLRHDGPEHVKIIAPTRSGKGIGVVIPTLLTWPESVLVYDLKSENWKATSGYRSTFSRTIYFNPNDPKSARFNPLLEVRKGPLEVRDVQNIADMIVDPDGRGLTDHWAKTGHALLVGTILHILYAEPDKTLSGVAKFLSDPARDIVDSLHLMMKAKHKDGETHPVVASAAREMLNKSENERSSVLSTAMSFLSLYRDPIVSENTSESDFRIMDLFESEKPVSLYLVIPPSDITRLRPLFRLVINQFCRRLTEELRPENENRRLLLLLDEFPALGRLDFFESAMAFLAGFKIKAMLISQSINQLESTYGVKNAIIDNTHVRVFYAPNTIETAETISRMLGQKTEFHEQRNFSGHRLAPWLTHVMISGQETARPLLTPSEVMELPHSDSLVFVAGHPPVQAYKIKYFDDPAFKKRVLEPAPIRRDGATRKRDSEWNQVIDVEKDEDENTAI